MANANLFFFHSADIQKWKDHFQAVLVLLDDIKGSGFDKTLISDYSDEPDDCNSIYGLTRAHQNPVFLIMAA